jgi:hypothetical protein
MLKLSPTLKLDSIWTNGVKQTPKKSIQEYKTPKSLNIVVSVPRKKGTGSAKRNSQNGTKIINTFLNHNAINTHFTNNYSDLLEYTEKAIVALKRNVDSATMLSEAYLHIYKCSADLKSEADVVSYSKNFVKMSLRWSNSPVIRNERAILIDCHKRFPEQDHLEPHPDIEEWIKNWEGTLKNEEARLWNIWYHKNLRKGREISEYLDISISGSYTLIKECRLLEERLRDYLLRQLAI